MKNIFDLPEPTADELAEFMQFAKLMAKIARHSDGREYRPPTACVIPLPDEIAPPAPRRPRRRVISLAERAPAITIGTPLQGLICFSTPYPGRCPGLA